MQERQLIFPEKTKTDHVQAAKEYIVKARRLRVVQQAPKIKGLRRKLAAIKPKPVPDAGLIYERLNKDGTKRKYKVMPNGEWRRVKE